MSTTHPVTRAARRARNGAVRLKALAEDALLTKHEGAALLCMGPEAFVAYARRWPALVAGARIVRVRPGSRGRVRWLRSALITHMREELLRPDLDTGGVESAGGVPRDSAAERRPT